MLVRLFHSRFTWLMALYFMGTWWVFRNDPFFGDAISSTARATREIYNSGLTTVFYPADFDPGHPTLYPYLLAVVWKLFLFPSLQITHAFGILFCVFMLAGFRKVCSIYLSAENTNLATVLALVHPTVLSQHAMVLNTALVTGCFLWAVYFLLSNNMRWYCAVLCLMMLTHLQSAFFLASLAVAHAFLFYTGPKSLVAFVRKYFLVYLLPFAVFAAWLVLHHRHAGFWVASPSYSDVSETNNLKQFVKGLAYCVWRFLDYGMLVPVGLLVYFSFKNRIKNDVLAITGITLLVTSFIMSGILKNTIAHRYFLGFELLVIPCLLLLVQGSKRYHAYFSLCFLALLLGNWQYIPGKTIADANVQYRHFFSIDDEMYSLAATYHAYGKAPIANPYSLTHLNWKGCVNIERMEDNIDSLPCVISSNLCAEITPEMEEKLQSWYGKSLESGPVYVSVYLNPTFYNRPDHWTLREPGSIETWMKQLKKKWK